MEWFKENWLVLLSVAIVVIALAAIITIALLQKKRFGEQKSTTKDLTVGAICIATAFALSFFGFELPQGGTVTLASVLPIMLYCHYYGARKGLIVCVAYTLLQFMQNPYILTPWQVILDYFLPYLSLIFVSLFPYKGGSGEQGVKSHSGFYLGAALYITVRYISHVLSGAIFFGEYAWDGWAAWPYSLVYNSFSIIDAAIAIGVASVLFANKAFEAFMTKSLYTKRKPDGCAKNDEGTAA